MPLTDALYFNNSKFDKYKGASIGYGRKDDLSPKSGKDAPPSNLYEIKSIFDKNIQDKKGFCMGQRYRIVILFINIERETYLARSWKL
jgi:hypothetical protein